MKIPAVNLHDHLCDAVRANLGHASFGVDLIGWDVVFDTFQVSIGGQTAPFQTYALLMEARGGVQLLNGQRPSVVSNAHIFLCQVGGKVTPLWSPTVQDVKEALEMSYETLRTKLAQQRSLPPK